VNLSKVSYESAHRRLAIARTKIASLEEELHLAIAESGQLESLHLAENSESVENRYKELYSEIRRLSSETRLVDGIAGLLFRNREIVEENKPKIHIL
jgi:hypothetical protein